MGNISSQPFPSKPVTRLLARSGLEILGEQPVSTALSQWETATLDLQTGANPAGLGTAIEIEFGHYSGSNPLAQIHWGNVRLDAPPANTTPVIPEPTTVSAVSNQSVRTQGYSRLDSNLRFRYLLNTPLLGLGPSSGGPGPFVILTPTTSPPEALDLASAGSGVLSNIPIEPMCILRYGAERGPSGTDTTPRVYFPRCLCAHCLYAASIGMAERQRGPLSWTACCNGAQSIPRANTIPLQ